MQPFDDTAPQYLAVTVLRAMFICSAENLFDVRPMHFCSYLELDIEVLGNTSVVVLEARRKAVVLGFSRVLMHSNLTRSASEGLV